MLWPLVKCIYKHKSHFLIHNLFQTAVRCSPHSACDIARMLHIEVVVVIIEPSPFIIINLHPFAVYLNEKHCTLLVFTIWNPAVDSPRCHGHY